MRSIRILLIAALVCATSSVAHAGVSSMRLVAPNVGWATTGEQYQASANKLLWTTDGGDHWRDITPQLISNIDLQRSPRLVGGQFEAQESIASISFLDAHSGWVLFCCGRSDTPSSDGSSPFPRYDLAKTTDAGATWSIARVDIPAGACLFQILLGAGS